MAEQNPKRNRYEIACLGVYELAKGGTACFFRAVKDDQLIGEQMSWKGVKGSAGLVYSVESQVPFEEFLVKGSCFTKTLLYSRAWPNETERREWQVRSEGVETEIAAARQRDKEEASYRELERMLGPVRRIYHRTNSQGKAAVLANVIRAIMTHPLEE